MKISQMLKREDFYAINERTLSKYYENSKGNSTLYVYERLNAIVTKRPAKAVKDYLYCEYEIRSNPIKKLIVNFYVFACMNFCGLLADKKIKVSAKVDNDVLIYPCNKKYRIFHFEDNTVDVIAKDGFSDNDLKQEIKFRSNKNLPDFVPTLVEQKKDGYSEKIIDGKPLARVQNGFEEYKQSAYGLLMDYAKDKTKTVNCKSYIEELTKQIEKLTTNKVEDKEKLESVTQKLAQMALSVDEIEVCFSHGDLQAGNIWIENGTNKVYIIDWESFAIRSVWYDKAVLFDGLRPGKISDYLSKDISLLKKATVLLEDIVFNLTELNNLPIFFGEKDFTAYISDIQTWLKEN